MLQKDMTEERLEFFFVTKKCEFEKNNHRETRNINK